MTTLADIRRIFSVRGVDPDLITQPSAPGEAQFLFTTPLGGQVWFAPVERDGQRSGWAYSAWTPHGELTEEGQTDTTVPEGLLPVLHRHQKAAAAPASPRQLDTLLALANPTGHTPLALRADTPADRWILGLFTTWTQSREADGNINRRRPGRSSRAGVHRDRVDRATQPRRARRSRRSRTLPGRPGPRRGLSTAPGWVAGVVRPEPGANNDGSCGPRGAAMSLPRAPTGEPAHRGRRAGAGYQRRVHAGVTTAEPRATPRATAARATWCAPGLRGRTAPGARARCSGRAACPWEVLMTAEPTPTAQTEVADAAAFGRLALVDPNTLELEVNTRLDANLDPHFCASIRDRGVREPITVRRRASDGTLVVRKGQRRTLAAVRVGVTQVPVIISPEPATEDGGEIDTAGDDYRAGQAERIVDQLVENQHRRGIGDAEEVAAHQQLLGLGFKPAEIAKVVRTKADRVRQTTQAAQSPRAAAIGARYELDLVQMSVIAEFEDDDEAVKLLTTVAAREPERFAHFAQRLRDERDEKQVHAAAVAELTEAGVTVLDRDDDGYAAAIELYRLRPSDDDPEGAALEEEAHRSCPGHAGEVMTFRRYGEAHQARVRWLCLDPATHGHAPLRESMRAQTGTAAAGAGESDEERAAREAREKETARLERRRVIDNNKAWTSAETVRRAWLAELLAKKAAPKGAAIFVAAELGQGGHALRKAMESGHTLACELLGLAAPAGGGYYSGRVNPLAEAARTTSAARATMLSLAIVLAGYEAGTHRGNWRNADPATQRDLAQLRDWGYQLSEVEQLALDPDAVPVDGTDPDDGEGGDAGTDIAEAGDEPDVGDPDTDSEEPDHESD